MTRKIEIELPDELDSPDVLAALDDEQSPQMQFLKKLHTALLPLIEFRDPLLVTGWIRSGRVNSSPLGDFKDSGCDAPDDDLQRGWWVLSLSTYCKDQGEDYDSVKEHYFYSKDFEGDAPVVRAALVEILEYIKSLAATPVVPEKILAALELLK